MIAVEAAAGGWRFFAATAVLLSASTLAVAIGIALWQADGHWTRRAPDAIWAAGQIRLAAGSGGLGQDGALAMTGNATNGAPAMAVVRNLRLDAPAYRRVRIAFAPTSGVPRKLFFVWSTQEERGRIHAAELPAPGGASLTLDLADLPGWRATVIGVGIGVDVDPQRPVRVTGIALQAGGATAVLGDWLAQWSTVELWRGSSINQIGGGARELDMPLPGMLQLGWMLAAAVALLVWRRRHRRIGFALAVMVVWAWLLLDLRWTWNLLHQNDDTLRRYAGRSSAEKLLQGEDARLAEFAALAEREIGAHHGRIFVFAEDLFVRPRLAYLLLPKSVYFEKNDPSMPAPSVFAPGDVLVIYAKTGVAFDAAALRLRWDKGELPVVPLAQGDAGFVFRVTAGT